MEETPTLSIIMINYNGKALTKQAIDSIFVSVPQVTYEVIVVENGGDETQKLEYENERVAILRGVSNHGFGNACNIGAASAKGTFLLFLNNDTIMHASTLDKCITYMEENPLVGAVGVRTLLADGTLDHACKRGFPTPAASLYYFAGLDRKYPQNRKYGVYRQTFVPEDAVSEVDSVSGSFLMMPKELFCKTGGFDEQFFMYGEDIDLCYRVKELNRKVVYYGAAGMTHLKGQSGLHTESEVVLKHFYDAMKIFYKKHYRKKYNFAVSAVVLAAIDAKHMLSLVKMRCKRRLND